MLCISLWFCFSSFGLFVCGLLKATFPVGLAPRHCLDQIDGEFSSEALLAAFQRCERPANDNISPDGKILNWRKQGATWKTIELENNCKKRGKRWKIRRYMSSLMIRVTQSWNGWGCWYLHNPQLSPDSTWIPSAQCPALPAAPHRPTSLCPLQASEPDASSEDSLARATPVTHAENQASLVALGCS